MTGGQVRHSLPQKRSGSCVRLRLPGGFKAANEVQDQGSSFRAQASELRVWSKARVGQ